jgi:Secretion system C-terminal sorting domain
MQSIILKIKSSSNIYLMGFAIIGMIILLSNKTGVPQAVTGAPGETAGASCNACHSGGNYITSLKFQLLNLDSLPVSKYIPGQKYIAKLAVSATNNPKSFGFQMVSLIDNGNKDAGLWSNRGNNVKSIELNNRIYLEQSNPRPDGLFYSQWTAPLPSSGSVTFYYAGLAVNLTGSTNGDSHANTKTTISEDISADTDQSQVSANYLYPNPTYGGIVNISNQAVFQVLVYDLNGRLMQTSEVNEHNFDAGVLQTGVYLIYGLNDAGNKVFSQLMTRL